MPSVTITTTGETPAKARDAYFMAAKQQMGVAMLRIEGAVKQDTPVRTGHLRRTITHIVEVIGNVISGAVGTDVLYGRWVDEGTGIYGPKHHVIVPKTKRALSFPEPGNRGFTAAGRVRSGKAGRNARFVTVRSVKGIKPREFFEKAIERTRTTWMQDLQQIPAVAAKMLGRAA